PARRHRAVHERVRRTRDRALGRLGAGAPRRGARDVRLLRQRREGARTRRRDRVDRGAEGLTVLLGLLGRPRPGALPCDLRRALGLLAGRIGAVAVAPERLRTLLDLAGPVVVPPLLHVPSLRRR